MSSPVVLDIGGSGARIALVEGLKLDVSRVEIDSYAELVMRIKQVSRAPTAVAVSLAGFVDGDSGNVRLSRNVSWAEGATAAKLGRDLGCAVVIMNDGEAHALAMLSTRQVRFGAVSIALGTSVSVGVLGADQELIRPCSGENWDLGEWKLHTRASHPDLWWALGSEGLRELEKAMGPEQGAEHFGYRLGAFCAQLTCIFQPRTIVLSGGLISRHWEGMRTALHSELAAIPGHYEKPRILRSPHEEAALVGAAHALATVRTK